MILHPSIYTQLQPKFTMIHPQSPLYLDGNTLLPQQLIEMAYNKHAQISLTSQATEKIRKSRKVIDNMLQEKGRIVYGINTGFGNFANKIIEPGQLKQLQVNLIRSHSVGVGTPISLQETRMLQILRINTLAKGRSGISEDNLHKYIQAFNKNFVPMIPCKGTVGASGDLAPLAHLALAMIGEGKAWDEQQGQYTDSKTILEKKGLEPIILKQKEGLALINGTQFMSSITSLALIRSENLIKSVEIILAFAWEIFGQRTNILNQKYIQTLPNKSLQQILNNLKGILDHQMSPLHEKRVQDFKDKPKSNSSIFYGADNLAMVLESLGFARKIITEEINGATDNPLVYNQQDWFASDMLLSAGNFHGEYIAKAADYISIAVHTLGKYSERRIENYVNGHISKLPEFLCVEGKGGINSGFMIAQCTSASLMSQNKVLVKPASVDSIPTSANQQDHVSMGGFASRKCLQLVKNVSYILAIELLSACQAVDLIKLSPSLKLEKVLKQIRKECPFMDSDFYLGQYIQKAQMFVENGLHKLL